MESLEFSQQQQQTDARRNLEELLPYFTYNFITTALTTSNNFQPPHHKQQGWWRPCLLLYQVIFRKILQHWWNAAALRLSRSTPPASFFFASLRLFRTREKHGPKSICRGCCWGYCIVPNLQRTFNHKSLHCTLNVLCEPCGPVAYSSGPQIIANIGCVLGLGQILGLNSFPKGPIVFRCCCMHCEWKIPNQLYPGF